MGGFHVVRKTRDVLRCCSICELSTTNHFLIVLYQTQPLVPTREINRRSGSHICRLLWNSVVYFWVRGNPPLTPVLRHLSPVRSLQRCSSNIQCNVIPPSAPNYSEWCCAFRLSDKNLILVSCLAHAYRMFIPSVFD